MLDIKKEMKKPEENPAINFVETDEIVKFTNDVILGESTYKKVYTLKGGQELILRTRTGKERNLIQERLATVPKTGLDMIRLNTDYNLAFSLASFNGKNYDNGTFDERLEKLYSMPSPKLNLFWDYQAKFDDHINKLVEVTANF